MSDNKDLTVLLTLWDRVSYTRRWMAYGSKVNLPFKVLIADGGSDESAADLLSNPGNFPGLDYEYVRYPYDASPTHYYAKVLDALNRVETPFVVLADNDDFYLVEGLLRSLEFLKDHSDFSSSRGIIGGVRLAANANRPELNNVYDENVSFVRRVYPDKSNLAPTAVERVHNYFSSYRANWYDVFRTEQTTSSFQVLRDLNTQDLILSQHIPMLLGVIAGKVNIDSNLYLVRQLEGLGSCDQKETRQNGDLFDRMLLETWSDDFRGFVNVIAHAISGKDGIPLDEARRHVKQGYRDFIGPHLIYDLQGQLPPKGSIRLAQNAISFMGPVGSALRKLYPPVQRALSGRTNGRKYVPASHLAMTDNDFKMISDFLAEPPRASKDFQRTKLKE